MGLMVKKNKTRNNNDLIPKTILVQLENLTCSANNFHKLVSILLIRLFVAVRIP